MFLQAGGIAQPTTAVKSKRLRRACGALDSAGRLCTEAIKEGFASLCSREHLFSLEIRMPMQSPFDSGIVSREHNKYAKTSQHQQPYKHRNAFLRIAFYP